ncbi:hypothetical protein EPN96_02845 [bacterium]|nr:MAG: hypothetical protein EPN96_02845 [bacterium]
MKTRIFVFAVALLAANGALCEPLRVGESSRRSLSLNLYQGNFAAVTDIRGISPPKGEAALEIEGVAQTLRGDTVIIEGEGVEVNSFVSTGERLSLLRLLEENLGREATIVFNEPGGLRRERGLLLSTGEETVWKVGERVLALPSRSFGASPVAWYEFDSVPEGFGVKPVLKADAAFGENAKELILSYQADGLGWSGRYLLTLDENTLEGSLEGWAVIGNYSGIDMDSAKVRLVAGEVAREDTAAPMMAEAADGRMVRASKAKTVQAVKQFEYQVFEMPGVITLKRGETKQEKFLGASGVKAEKVRRYEWRTYYLSGGVPEEKNVHPRVLLRIKNTSDNGLGMPLPAGVVRVYSPDAGKSRTLLGEDSTGNTQKDGLWELAVGSAFDISAERKLLSTRQTDQWTSEGEFEITVENAGEETEVEVAESFGGRFRVLQSTHQYNMRDADTVVFTLPLPKEGKAVLRFKVRLEQR